MASATAYSTPGLPAGPVPLTRDVQHEAAEALARAFMRDPVYAKLLPDEADRLRALRVMFGGLVSYTLRYGTAATTPDVAGVACWLPPGATTVSFWRIAGAGFGLLRAMLTFPPRARRTFLADMAYTDRAHHRLMPEPHWYLWALGVAPERQGQGIGTMLLQTTLLEADRVGAPCYLETQTTDNVAFYERRGFRVAESGALPTVGLPIWHMVRDPLITSRRSSL